MTLSTKNKVGLVIAFVLGALDMVSLLAPTPDGDVGPPIGILVLAAICGLITVIAVVIAWRKLNAAAIRVAAGARIVSMLTSLPAFFVDVPSFVKALVAVFVVVTIIAVVLMLTPARRGSEAAA